MKLFNFIVKKKKKDMKRAIDFIISISSHNIFILSWLLSICLTCFISLPATAVRAGECASRAAPYWKQGSFVDVDQVEDLMRRCIDADPHDAEALYLLGVISIQKNDFPAALEHFSSAIRHAPRFLKAYVNRAELWLFLKNTEEGLRDYATALDLAPADDSIRYKRANVLMNNARFREAIDDYSVIIGHSPDFAEAYNARALAYGALNQKAKMCSDFGMLCDLGFCMNLEKAKARNDCQ